MIRLIRENAISDIHTMMKGLSNWDKQQLLRYLRDSNINIEKCHLEEIPAPSGYTTAKRSPEPILAINADGEVAVFGEDEFKVFNVDYSGRNKYSISKMFKGATEFYKIVKDDDYESRKLVRKSQGRGQGKFYDMDSIIGKADDYIWADGKPFKGARYMTKEEHDLYNPAINKQKYLKMLEETGLDRFIKEYGNLCEAINDFNKRLQTLDISSLTAFDNVTTRDYSPIQDYQEALGCYHDAIRELQDLHRIITDIRDDRGYYSNPGDAYQKLKRQAGYITKNLDRAHRQLDNIENI